jgi:ligand-binding SRPBCC domain-containing protein
MMLTVNRTPARQLSIGQVDEVRAALTAVLESESFATSRRCRDFLECVVELTLAGDYESLTERFLGVKLFGRSVDYETATDSIVRVRANDVRRRLMQYYSTSSPEAKVRIEMAAGGYVPEFQWQAAHTDSSEHVAGDTVRLTVSPAPEWDSMASFAAESVETAPVRRSWHSSAAFLWGSIAILTVLFVLFMGFRARHQSNFDAFWQPVLDASGQPVLNLPTTDTFQLTMNSERTLAPLSDLQPGQSFPLKLGDFIGFHDWHVSLPVLQATLSVALALDHKGKTPLVRIGTDLRRDELRGHPVIAIGSFSNPWTEATVSGLRFTFDRGASDTGAPRIRDAQNPQRSWELSHTYPGPQDKDYAIITRTFDPVTREPFVSLAGLHSFGNQIAGEFVSQESSWSEVARRAPPGWQKMNLQVLLEADIVGTTPGSPRIVDVYFWK